MKQLLFTVAIVTMGAQMAFAASANQSSASHPRSHAVTPSSADDGAGADSMGNMDSPSMDQHEASDVGDRSNGLSADERAASGMTSNPDISDDQQDQQTQNSRESQSDNRNYSQGNSAPAPAGGEVRSPSPRFQNTDRPGFFDIGVGPAFSMGLKSDQAMYDINGGYTHNFSARVAGKIFGDFNLGTGADSARFVNAGFGGEYYPAGKYTTFGAPYITGDIGYAFTRDSDDHTKDAPAIGVGAGFKFQAQRINYDVIAHYTVLAAQINDSNPSILGIRVALNF